jgi:hypothetical protein
MALSDTPAEVEKVTLTDLHRRTGRLLARYPDGGRLAVVDRYGTIVAVVVVGLAARELIEQPAAIA